MKAVLSLTNIGGFKGSKEFTFESGALNIIEAPNSGGKSSLIKAILGVLSVPQDGKFDPYYLKEAKYLGVGSDELNTQEGFVNIHSDIGSVSLNMNDNTEIYEVKQNGSYIKLPQHGDQKFLFSGILSNDTKILRQLRNTDEDNPDNFKWAVTKLSNADKYDEIVDYLKIGKEDFDKKKIESDNSIKRMKVLNDEVKKIKDQLKKVDEEMQKLKPQFDTQTLEIINERESLQKVVGAHNKKIIKRQSEINGLLKLIENKKNESQDVEKGLEKCEKQYEDLELFDKKAKNLEDNEIKNLRIEKVSSINEEISNLKEERGKIDGVYNLFYLAQTSVHDKNMTICPLCEEGHLTQKKLDEKIDDLKEKKANFSNKIMDKNKEIKIIDDEINRIIKMKKELFENIRIKKDEKSRIEKFLKERAKELDQASRELTEIIETKEEKEKRLSELIRLISGGQEEINKEYTKNEELKKSLEWTINSKMDEISKSDIEITGKRIKPEIALLVIKKYVKILDDLISYAKEMADKQRQAAASKFNESIETLMKDLDFKEFRSVKLNKDFRLWVERLDPKNQEYVTQLVSTLSTSEKLTVALILQIALKETYLPHIPFLLLDDVMEDFDEDRRNKIYKYLYNKAKEQNWIVLLTKLNESKTPIHVVNWNPN